MFLPFFKCGSTFIHRNIHKPYAGRHRRPGRTEPAPTVLRELFPNKEKPPAQAAFENVVKLPLNLDQFRGRYIP